MKMNLALRKQELLPWTFFPSRDEKPLLIRYQVWRCQGVCYIIRDSNVLNCNLHCNSLEAEAKISAKVVDLGRPDRLIKVVYCSICSVKRSRRHKFQCFEGFHRYSNKGRLCSDKCSQVQAAYIPHCDTSSYLVDSFLFIALYIHLTHHSFTSSIFPVFCELDFK